MAKFDLNKVIRFEMHRNTVLLRLLSINKVFPRRLEPYFKKFNLSSIDPDLEQPYYLIENY